MAIPTPLAGPEQGKGGGESLPAPERWLQSCYDSRPQSVEDPLDGGEAVLVDDGLSQVESRDECEVSND